MARHLHQWNQLHHLCHGKVLAHQNDLRGLLIKLLSLNKTARHLRVQKTRTLAALAVAVAAQNPPAIAAVRKRLQALHSRQLVLSSQQKLILGLARTSARKFKGEVQRQPLWSGAQLYRSYFAYAYPLAVRPVPEGALAPEYLPVARFSKQQSLGISFSSSSLTPAFMKALGRLISASSKTNPSSRLQISCGATIKQENKKWFTHLNAAKPLSK